MIHDVSSLDVPSPGTAKAREVAPFLKNLRAILETESPTILRWTPDGRAFEILDIAMMSLVILPKYFKHAKYTSFQRQLNYFNFRKWTKSKAVVCTFSNPHFVRDQPSLAWRINRKKSVPSHIKAAMAGSLTATKRRPKRVKATEALQLQSDMTIKLPVGSSDTLYSFASPTEVYSPALSFPQSFDSRSDAHTSRSLEPMELDWVDTLYSSLSGIATRSELDSGALYFDPTSMAAPSTWSNAFALRL